jgi:hypothetical protein
MLISSATPQELIDWFHKGHHGQSILCVLLAPAQTDQVKLTALIQEVYATDAMLGPEVAFLLLHPDAKKPLGLMGPGGIPVLQGTVFPDQGKAHSHVALPLRDTLLFSDVNTEHDVQRQEIARQSARAMAYFVPEFMRIFGIPTDELPALCVSVKGIGESVVVPLGPQWQGEDLPAIFAEIQKLAINARQVGETLHELVHSLPGKISRLEQAVEQIESTKRKIGFALEGLLSRHQASQTDRKILSEFFTRESQSVEDFNTALMILSIAGSRRFLKDERIQKIQGLLNRMDELRDEFGTDRFSPNVIQPIAEQSKVLAEQRAHLHSEIRKIRNGHLVRTTTSPENMLTRVERHLTLLDRVYKLGRRGFAAFEGLRKLLGY